MWSITFWEKEGHRIIYISPDRTVDERRAFKKLWEELQEKRESDIDRIHYIRNKKTVSADKSL